MFTSINLLVFHKYIDLQVICMKINGMALLLLSHQTTKGFTLELDYLADSPKVTAVIYIL